ncbi:ABC transporter ATP-binding protein/permease [Candidatus Saccharibacteria bacterium]|nr:ABC transporter ATP-binding protein/permease [Candidatus Saccharibacteria bacterium]MCL1962967.1 ABC transporter ATP-binding protein/permease [Candidatus Saccharibacteria bacterium]
MFKHFQNYRLVYGFLWRTFGRLWRIRLSYILRFLTGVCRIVLFPIAIALMISNLATGDYDNIWFSVWLYVGTSFSLGVLNTLIKLTALTAESDTYAKITSIFFEKLITTDIEYFNSNMSGYLTTMTRKFTDSCMSLVRKLRDNFMICVLRIILPLIIMVFCDWLITLVVFVISIVLVLYLFWTSKLIAPHRAATRTIFRRNSGKISDVISNVLAIRSSAQEKSFIGTIKREVKKESDTYKKRFIYTAKLFVGREVCCVIFFIVVLCLIVWRAQTGVIDLTAAVLIVNYLVVILAAADDLNDCLNDHDDLIDEIVPGFEILNRVNKIADPAKPEKFYNVRGDIEFRNVSFSYQEQKGKAEVFRDFSLSIPHGQKIGVVGLSGAGKSTLTKLVLRFDDVDNGKISIDGHDVRNVRQNDLHRAIAYVPQEPLLLHASIRENVVVAKPNAGDAEIECALRAAHAWDFVQDLPDKMDSIVGERGVKLSGGQKQRIAIARAFLQYSPIMILDEATSALDSESEQIIKDSFKEILRGKTAIVVAHRLSTLSEMDRIIIIDNGRLVEDGTHDELLAAGKLYAKLWRRGSIYRKSQTILA